VWPIANFLNDELKYEMKHDIIVLNVVVSRPGISGKMILSGSSVFKNVTED